MRIQILPLPSVMVGDDMEEPFAMVFDQAEDGIDKLLLHEFARLCGAKTLVFYPGTVEIVDRYADVPPPKNETRIRFDFPKVFDTGKGGEVLNWRDEIAKVLLNRKRVEPDPVGYTVLQMVRGEGSIPPGTEDLETRQEAVARQKMLTEDNPPHRGLWVACKVVPLDEQEQR